MLAENQGVRPPDIDLAPAAPTAESRTATLEDADFAVVLLQALSRMAGRSKRRQADVTAAMRGADIAIDLTRVRTALRLLCAQGAIENLVPLSDGGLLLSVTQKAGDRPYPVPDWLPLDQLDATAG